MSSEDILVLLYDSYEAMKLRLTGCDQVASSNPKDCYNSTDHEHDI